ncbi:hypothetical protein HDU86_001975 [Geranomyces michiganensis]|nr:hypothetical protein HDU86_001975 [Geranomyces michiganensis]
MAFIKNVVSLFSPSPAGESSDPFPDSVPFTDTDPCAACADPCTDHPQLPAYLAKKIEPGPLVGTAGKPYKRHIMVLEGSGRSWPERLESTDGSNGITPIIGELAAQVGERVGYRTIVTAAETFGDDTAKVAAPPSKDDKTTPTHAHAQVMLFPDLLRIPDVTAQTAAELVPALLEHGTVPQAFAPTAMRGKAWIFVCTHKKRDKRCGVAGPMLVDEFRKAVVEMGLEGEVEVFGCSHFGGHKFAGNIIIYHRNEAVDGNWYGRVKTCHVRPILQTTINDGKVFKELWRGAMQRDEAIASQNRCKVLAGDW